VNEQQITDLLRGTPAPDERAAEERGWRVVQAAFEQRSPARRPARRPNRVAIAIAIAIGALVLALTPAGAKVADLVHDVVHPGAKNARPELTSLPTSGRLLVTAPSGSWVVAEDGGKRRLGAYDDAAWSPHGLFVAVTRGRELTAVEPDGTVRWSLSADHHVSDPAWAPSGIRVAYRAGDSLRVVAGDGTGDRRLARNVAPTPPAWAPEGDRNVLAFVGPDQRVRAVDVESGKALWSSAPFGGGVQSLQWSSSGRLLVMTRSFFVILDERGRAIAKGPTDGPAEAAAFAANGKTIALARRTNAGSELVLLSLKAAGLSQRELFAGPGRFTNVTWSPDGAWALLDWRDADQWLFIRPADRKVVAVSGISRQFAPGASARVGFPRVAGWCCAATGTSAP
jgi:PQQ-like domain/WD40-like Beta Propeller Repeat